jgi:hypothetical protein
VLRIKNPLIEIKKSHVKGFEILGFGEKNLPYANETYPMLMKYSLEQGIW